MMPPSEVRWQLLRVLFNESEPLDCVQLANQVHRSKSHVRGLLRRPIAARWVYVIEVPGKGAMKKYLYEITDLGRRVLTENTEEP